MKISNPWGHAFASGGLYSLFHSLTLTLPIFPSVSTSARSFSFYFNLAAEWPHSSWVVIIEQLEKKVPSTLESQLRAPS